MKKNSNTIELIGNDGCVIIPNSNINNKKKKLYREKDFEKLAVIGKGFAARVLLVKEKETEEYFAMKIIDKARMVETDQIEHTKTERVLLQYFHHPFLIRMNYAFQDSESLYLIMEFVNGGDLFFWLRKKYIFEEKIVKLYAAEIFLALQFLHKNKVVYRDLKPENILLDSSGHIRLTDFGLAKILKNAGDRTKTFCGSAEYLPPEVLQQGEDGYTQNVDWWSFGILLFEMLIGYPPFYSENVNEMYVMILSGDVNFPKEPQISNEVKDLILKLLSKDPNKRIEKKSIQSHPWFKDINFDDIYKLKVKPTFKPNVKSPHDLQNVDKAFLQMNVNEKIFNKAKITKYEEMKKQIVEDFKDFDYTDNL